MIYPHDISFHGLQECFADYLLCRGLADGSVKRTVRKKSLVES